MFTPRTMLVAALATVSLGAVVASAALAAPEWLFEEGAGSGQLVLLPSESISSAAATFIVITVPALNVEVPCNKINSAGAKVTAGNTDSAESITFEECSVEKPTTTCKLRPRTMITTSALSTKLIEETEGEKIGEDWDEFVPTLGGAFTAIVLEACTVEGSFKLAGKLCGLILSPEIDEEIKLMEFGDAAGKQCKQELKFGTNSATLTGEAEFKLSGVNAGKKWSVL